MVLPKGASRNMKNRFRTAVVVLALALGSILVTPQPALADSAIPYPNWQELMSALGLGEMWGNFFANWHMPPWQPYTPPPGCAWYRC